MKGEAATARAVIAKGAEARGKAEKADKAMADLPADTKRRLNASAFDRNSR